MFNPKAQVLIISPEEWDGSFVSKHHYAVTLSLKGIKVYFLNPPDNTLSECNIRATQFNNLWVISAPIVAKGLRFYPKKLRRWFETHWLEKLEKKIRSPFSTIWLFENSRFFNMNFAGSRLKIYHQVDLNQDFYLTQASSTADICFCTSDFIMKKLIRYNDQVYKIHHGVTIPLIDESLNNQQRSYFAQNKIHVAYVGNLGISYLDIALLSELIQKYPNVEFHLVGSYKEEDKLYCRHSKSKNVRWWGQVASELIPCILSFCNVQLLTYKASNEWEMKQLASPHKLMEYISSGKVTVATYTDEYKDKRNLLEMVDDSYEFTTVFNKVINNLTYYNSAEKQKSRVTFAKNNTYPKQIETILSYLQKHNLHF